MRDVTVPDHLRPRWRELPALAWTAACAMGAGPAWVRRLAALASAPIVWLPVLVGHQTRGAVVRCSRHAVLLLAAPTSARAARSRVIGSLVLLAVVSLVSVVTLALAEVEQAVTSEPSADVTAHALDAWFVLLVLGGLLPALRAVPGVVQLHQARLAGLLPEWGEALHSDLFAAWPSGCGHGRALLAELETVLARQPGVVVIAVARNQRVAAFYGRYGLRPVTPGSLVLIRTVN